MFNELKKSHMPYAKKIMIELYLNKKLDVDNICSKFVKKRHSIVRASIKDLERCHLLKSIDKSKVKDDEKIYSLTKIGMNFISEEATKLSSESDNI